MRLEPVNIVCPACGSGNYMRHLIGKNVGYLDMKCINCNSYFNFDELYKRRIGEILKPKPQTNYELLISKTPEELANFLGELTNNGDFALCPDSNCTCGITGCAGCWLDWLKSQVEVDNG